jgi:hypothetical protein
VSSLAPVIEYYSKIKYSTTDLSQTLPLTAPFGPLPRNRRCQPYPVGGRFVFCVSLVGKPFELCALPQHYPTRSLIRNGTVGDGRLSTGVLRASNDIRSESGEILHDVSQVEESHDPGELERTLSPCHVIDFFLRSFWTCCRITFALSKVVRRFFCEQSEHMHMNPPSSCLFTIT